jgi:aminopeptidase N
MPDRVDQRALGTVAYRKPGLVMLMLRDHLIGPETMDRAMREYVRRWAFKHPTPGDWFRTIENVSGQDLAWYWRAFWYGDDVLDIGIDGVKMGKSEDGETVAQITLTRHTSVPFPVEIRLKLRDGTTQDVKLPVDIWSFGDHYEATVPVRGEVVGARLWPTGDIPDWNDGNDTWGDAPGKEAVHPETAAGLAPPIAQKP